MAGDEHVHVKRRDPHGSRLFVFIGLKGSGVGSKRTNLLRRELFRFCIDRLEVVTLADMLGTLFLADLVE